MGIERQGTDRISRVLSEIDRQSRETPDIPKQVLLARYLGEEAKDKLRRVDSMLAEKLNGFQDEILFPGSRLYKSLDAGKELNLFLNAFGYAWIASNVEVYIIARKTNLFDFKLLKELYNQITFDTATIKFPDTTQERRRAIPLNSRIIESAFQKDPSGAGFFTREGLMANPILRGVLLEVGAVPAICSVLNEYGHLSKPLRPHFVQGVDVNASMDFWKGQFSPQT